jgi:hypothetical protein
MNAQMQVELRVKLRLLSFDCNNYFKTLAKFGKIIFTVFLSSAIIKYGQTSRQTL